MTRFLVFPLLATVLWGCTTMSGLSEPPRVSLVSIAPVDFQLFEQRFRATLQVQNPNSKDITIRGLDYEIEVNEQLFAQGVSGKPIAVPAYSENIVQVEIVSTLQRVMEQLQALGSRGKLSLDYVISGHVSVDGIPIPIPFEYRDTLGLPGFEQREKKYDGERPPRRNAKEIAI